MGKSGRGYKAGLGVVVLTDFQSPTMPRDTQNRYFVFGFFGQRYLSRSFSSNFRFSRDRSTPNLLPYPSWQQMIQRVDGPNPHWFNDIGADLYTRDFVLLACMQAIRRLSDQY